MSITEVAYLCGFANSNHFTTLYKKVFGLTPAPIAAAHRVKRGPQAGQGKNLPPAASHAYSSREFART
ncbi:HTH-type transcriptional activator RhaS [Klebsiella aerogenes]|nr:HTH-type transcriptional activator RhaS [Klebsiella aerogenes]